MTKKTIKEIKPVNPNSTYETMKTIFLAALIALTIRSVAYEPFSIPSGSMIPSLLVGDYLFVSKSSYGFSRYSFPMGLFPINGRIKAQQPERGDVIVFRKPTNDSIDYIKRLIGLPGDTVQMKNGRLYINHKMVKRSYIGEYKARLVVGGELYNFKRYKETLPNGKVHEIIERSDIGPLDDTPAYKVPSDSYFMMGDNRDGSQDSRVMNEVGFVPFENLIGRAENIFFSVDESAQVWELWKYPDALRPKRFFQKIK